MIKEQLSIDEKIALGRLVDLVKEIGLFVSEGDESTLYTTGETLNLECFDKDDWELCLKANCA